MKGEPDSCLFRSLYSTTFYVSNFLMRVLPFPFIYRQIQGGKMDNSDREKFRVFGYWVDERGIKHKGVIPQQRDF